MKHSKVRTNCHPVLAKESTPVRRGKIYCSPSCGFHCTKVGYDKAYRASVTLVMLLKGSGWLGEVWESQLDWRFKASAGPLTVFGDHKGPRNMARYSCAMVGIVPDNFWSKDPNVAVAHTVEHCLAGAIKGMTKLFEACQAANMTSEFFRQFTQLDAIEFLRYPAGRSRVDEALMKLATGRKERRPAKVRALDTEKIFDTLFSKPQNGVP